MTYDLLAGREVARQLERFGAGSRESEQRAKLVAQLDRIEAKIADIDAAQAKHSCGGTVAGALICKKCAARKATTALPSYSPRAITSEQQYRAALAEYTGAAWAERAEQEAEYERNAKRRCGCGHSYNSHSATNRMRCYERKGYGWCECWAFHEVSSEAVA